MSISFFVLAIAWIFSDPGFIPGWIEWFPEPGFIKDGVPAMLIGIILFIIPGLYSEESNSYKVRSFHKWHLIIFFKPILNWHMVQRQTNWGVLLINGGGFAIAEASDQSGFSFWFANLLSGLGNLQPWLIALIVTFVVTFFTEVCSNTAAAALFSPLLAGLAIQIGIPPIYLMAPAITACSFAFMLPSGLVSRKYGYILTNSCENISLSLS